MALVLGGAQAKHSSHGQASNSGSGSGSGSWLDDRLVRLPPDKDPGARASEAAAAAETQAQAGGGGSGRLGGGGVAGEQADDCNAGADLPLRSWGSWW